MKIIVNTRRRQQSGWILVIIAILVVVGAAGYAYYKIARVVSHIQVPPADTNDTDTYYSPTNQAPHNNIVMSASLQTDAALPQTVSPPPFALQYGVKIIDTNLNGQGWLNAGTNLVGPVDGTPYAFINTSNEYAFMLTYANGQVFYYDYDATTANLLSSWTSSSLKTVVIQITTNMADWSPIYTNTACPMNEILNFVDTNPPLVAGFYRLVIY